MTPIQKSSPNKCARSNWDGKNWVPDIMVYHIADGFESGLDWMCNSASGISSHFFITKAGKVYQLVPLNEAAWTQGLKNFPEHPNYTDSKHEIIKSRATNPNAYCISIEYEGFYDDYIDKKTGKVTGYGCKGKITDEQVKATINLMPYIQSELKRLYKTTLKLDRLHHIGHCEINPMYRPCCPGELFPYDEIVNGYNKSNESITIIGSSSTSTVNPKRRADYFFLKDILNSTMTNPWGKNHTGVDYAAKEGTPIHSPVNGKVTKTDMTVTKNCRGTPSYGIYVVVQSKDGCYHFFAHLSKICVKLNSTVKKGTLIGLMGNTGDSTGPHLHYEIRKQAAYHTDIDPNTYNYDKANNNSTTTINESTSSVKYSLKNCPLYASSTSKTPTKEITGIYYRYDDKEYNGRIRITTSEANIGKYPAGVYVTGYIDKSLFTPKAGDVVKLENVPLYPTSTSKVNTKTITGTYYLYDGVLYSNRYRICPKGNVRKTPVNVNVTGYIDKKFV